MEIDPTSGTSTIASNIFLDANVVITNATGHTFTLSGFTNDLKAQTMFITNAGSVTITSAGAGVQLTNSTGTGKIVKAGAGNLTVNSTNTNYKGQWEIHGGTLTQGTGSNIGTNSVIFGNGITWALPSSGNVFQGNPFTILAGATATNTTSALGNGISGTFTSGDSASTLVIGGSVSYSATTPQFEPFLGTVLVPSSTTLRFSATSGTFGGTNTTFQVNGTLQPRNPKSAGTILFDWPEMS